MSKGKEFKKPGFKSTKRFEVKKEPPKINYDNQKPIFAFYHMQYRKTNCLSQSAPMDKSTVTDKLVALSQITWKDIISSPRTGLGFEKIPQRQFKVPLPPVVTPDVTIKVFRHSVAGRIAGFRKNDIYHILIVGDNLYDH